MRPRPHARRRPLGTPLLFLFVAVGTLLGLGAASPASGHPDCPPPYEAPCNPEPIKQFPQPASPSLDIYTSPLRLTPLDSVTAVQTMQWGFKVTTTVPASHAKESYWWRYFLREDQSLQPLSNGGLAIVSGTEADPDPGTYVDPDADAPVDPGDIEVGPPEVSDPPNADDPAYDEDGNHVGVPVEDEDEGDNAPANDGSWDPDSDPADGDPHSPDSLAEGERVMAIFDAAEAEIDGRVDVVVTPPLASDASGVSVPADLGGAGIGIRHTTGTYSYPVTATVEMIENPEVADDGEAGTSASGFGTAAEAASCPFPAEFVFYNPNGYRKVLDALGANATPCAQYYIFIPAPSVNCDGKSGDELARCKAENRAAKRRVRARTTDGQRVVDVVRQKGPNFHPVAEFHWQSWVALTRCRRSPGRPPGPSNPLVNCTWALRGMHFRQRMKEAGYTPAAGATWALNEFPTTLRRNPATRQRAREAVRGLYHGPQGSAKLMGITFPAGFAQTPKEPYRLSYYKRNLKRMTQNAAAEPGTVTGTAFWRTMRSYVRLWGQEVYTECQRVCVGTNVGARASKVNEYVQHAARLAVAGGSRSSTARSFFIQPSRPRRGYFSLMTAFEDGAPYGRTHALMLDQLKGLISLQVYSVRRFAGVNSYPKGRIGFAWNDAGDNAVVLARHLAEALVAAYGANGQAGAVCERDGTNWCLKGLAGARFVSDWRTFGTW